MSSDKKILYIEEYVNRKAELLFKTKLEHHVHIAAIAEKMKKEAGLTEEFIAKVVSLSEEYEGCYDLLTLWDDHEDIRKDVEGDFREFIEEILHEELLP